MKPEEALYRERLRALNTRVGYSLSDVCTDLGYVAGGLHDLVEAIKGATGHAETPTDSESLLALQRRAEEAELGVNEMLDFLRGVTR